MINHNAYNLMFDGVNKTRSFKSATELKRFIENDCKFTPVYWMGVDFYKPVEEDKARMKIASFINTINHKWLRTHIWPLVAWNKNSDGLIQNDVHIILCLEQKVSLSAYKMIIKELKRCWRNGKEPHIQIYQRGKNAVHYTVMRHKEISFMVFCPDRGTCRNKHKNKNDCIYRRNPELLLKKKK